MRIKYQLLLSLLVASASMIFLMYLLNSWAFSRGFLNYIRETEVRALQPLLTQLHQEYEKQGDWSGILPRERWRSLLQEHGYMPLRPSAPALPSSSGIYPPPIPSDGPDGRRYDRGPPDRPPAGRHGFENHLILIDENRRVLHGMSDRQAGAIWEAVIVNEQVVGQLGLLLSESLSSELDRVFERQQTKSFAYSAGLLFVISVLISIALASWIVKPILLIKKGVEKLSKGNFASKVLINRRDELGSLADNINQLGHSLQQNQHSRQQWFAEISHEIRTPVSIINAELEALQDGVIKLDQNAITSLHEETSRLSRIIDDLHTLSMSDIGALNYEFEAIDIKQLLQAYLNEQAYSPVNSKLTFVYNPCQQPATIKGDKRRLIQLFENLRQNSLRYTVAPGRVEVSMHIENNTVNIQWIDSKPGVDKQHLDKLFDPLYRTEESRNREYGGSGLGLAIVSKVVSAHRGTVNATESRLGGLCISISIPQA